MQRAGAGHWLRDKLGGGCRRACSLKSEFLLVQSMSSRSQWPRLYATHAKCGSLRAPLPLRQQIAQLPSSTLASSALTSEALPRQRDSARSSSTRHTTRHQHTAWLQFKQSSRQFTQNEIYGP